MKEDNIIIRKVNPPRKILQIQFYCNKLGAGSTFMYMHFPGEEILKTDIDAGNSYVIVNNGMIVGTVFLVLIFISLLISCFKFIPQIMDKFTKKPSVEEKPEVVEETSETVTANEEDDSELIAVIAAAIAASEQTSTDSFVVRSIRRR